MQKFLKRMRVTESSYHTNILYYVIIIGVLWTYSIYRIGAEPEEVDIRARARDIGIQIGSLPTGIHNAITDVAGVKVGHVTLNEGDSIRTGVTAVIPSDDIWTARLFGAAYTIHGNGEATGIARINQAGWIESPILLTNTLSVGAVHDGVVRYIVKRYPDNNIVLPIVAECYDGGLNDISGLHVTAQHAIEAIENATSGPVVEGCVGGGTGMRCYQFKAGIGTASRVLPEEQGGWTVGVLVNSNGGRRHQLRIDGVPVGTEITGSPPKLGRDGSFIIVIATDAPLTHRQLKQLAIRATHGLARTGTPSTDGSGEFVIAFSTANIFQRRTETGTFQIEMLVNGRLSSLFQAVIEATEEAIVNSMTMATTTTGRNGRTMHAIPLAELQKVMKAYGR
ncbi:Beta-peptidyl aminopeptidase BapA [Geodia barretti]|uniref:Beta-peptidyl aminopeptidase BapA n=1 Tax=Geodia barretti TaxID=519541 RepID=A0AA35SFU8_GEOBA|nr:Beta-peptidyl aminopeptidase BapA [Geodia barretti]